MCTILCNTEICEGCKGTGKILSDQYGNTVPCFQCGGIGDVPVPVPKLEEA